MLRSARRARLEARKSALQAAFAGILCVLSPTSAATQPVVVASKIDTEGALLGNMILAVLAVHGIAAENRLQLGPTNIVRAAILAGQIDIYPEYTGNGARFFDDASDPAWRDLRRGWELVKRLDAKRNQLVWLDPAPANNTWTIAVRLDLAKSAHLSTLDDLSHYLAAGGRFKLAASAEFVESPAALPAFERAYGFRLVDAQLLTLAGGNTAATLRAAAEAMSGVNAAMAYGTDGALAALGLVALADDKKAQIVYAPAPVVRAAVLARLPQIAGLLDPVFAGLTLTVLQRLNAAIAVDGRDARSVASAYLQSRQPP
jgi:osmoprotectant transport system substrate-binding protein